MSSVIRGQDGFDSAEIQPKENLLINGDFSVWQGGGR